MYNKHNLPTWRTLAVRHSGVRTKRWIERRPWKWKKDTVFSSCFYPKEERPRDAPKNKGRRLHLENLGDK